MKKILFILLIIVLFIPVKGQDIHYSQFFNSPLNLNPALTGMFSGDYRFAGNYRSQWASVTVPFTTFSLSADAQNPLGKKNLGAGILINHDQAGDSRFKTFQTNFSGSYIKSMNKDSSLVFSAGLMIGFTVRSINYTALRFDEQYNGYYYDPSLPNGESFKRESRFYPNFNLGAALYKKRDGRQYILGGISFNNLQSPKQSFYNVNTIKLDRKFTLHGEAAITITDKIDAIPSLNIQFQGKYSEIVPGATGRYVLKESKGTMQALDLGAWYRFKDAFYIMVGYETEKMRFGISYDINTSDLIPASNKRGAFELGAIYILDYFKPKRIMHRVCPNYL